MTVIDLSEECMCGHPRGWHSNHAVDPFQSKCNSGLDCACIKFRARPEWKYEKTATSQDPIRFTEPTLPTVADLADRTYDALIEKGWGNRLAADFVSGLAKGGWFNGRTQ